MGTLRFLPALATLAVVSSAFAAEPKALAPGAPVPELSVKKWFKGTPVTKFDKDKTYVVEFWATWCGPCKQSIPHLTEMAKKNKDVTFVGVSIWEDDKDDNIQMFVDGMGDKMNYNVAYSGNKDGMAETWMKPFARNGIPSAFIVKQNKVVWVGHPMEMDKPLEEIKAGTFDSKAFKAKYEAEAAETRTQIAANDDIRAAVKLFDDGKKQEAKEALAKVEKKYPAMGDSFQSIRFGWLAQEDPQAWETSADEMAASKDPKKLQMVTSFALSKAQKPEGADMARKAIAIALKATEGKDFLVEYYAMNVYKQTGDTQLALDAVNKSIELFPASSYKDNADLKAALEKMKADFTAKLASG
ncbi:hypothetical protein BH11ARM2_BH11ARM2_01290 [soil metagenome]